MPRRPVDELVLTAAAVARYAPTEWSRFVGAFTSYSQEQVVNLMQSTLEELPRSQGRAQIAAQLQGIMAECLQMANKLEPK